MEHTRAEYLQRLNEVNLYFSTFKVLDNSSCTLESVDIAGNHQSLPINSDLVKIIKYGHENEASNGVNVGRR